MNSKHVRNFQTQIASIINTSGLPMEVVRLALGEIISKVEIASEQEIKKISEMENEEKLNKNEE